MSNNESESSFSAATKFVTWVQIIALIAIGLIQIPQITNPETVWMGALSMMLLAILGVVIVLTDYHAKKKTEAFQLDILAARHKGAIDALKELEANFEEDAKNAKSNYKRKLYDALKREIERQRKLLVVVHGD